MTKQERILENVNATMTMEDMPLTDRDKQRIRDCLDGKYTFQQAVNEIIKKHKKQVVM